MIDYVKLSFLGLNLLVTILATIRRFVIEKDFSITSILVVIVLFMALLTGVITAVN